MNSPADGEVTRLLHDVERGERHAAEALLPLVYDQLRELARHRMGEERDGHTLQATALVHEAYLRLVGDDRPLGWAGRAHFFHAAAEAMRRILIDHARGKESLKRGGAGRAGPEERAERSTLRQRRTPLGLLELAHHPDPSEILDLDDAVTRLEAESPDVAAVVRLRFYAGLTIEETAELLGVSAQSVKRDWAYARAWLFRQLGY